jgi:hypothetical protein
MGKLVFIHFQNPHIMKKRSIILALMILCFYGNIAFSTVRLICPDDIELGCNPKQIPIPNANKLEYETDCKKAKVKLIDRLLIEDQENCKNILTLTYEATDDCGDTDQCSMTITWMVDEEKPVFVNCPGPIDLGCNPEGIPAPDPDQLEATDNCGIKAIVFHNQKFKTNKCKTTLTREYRAYDHCGNYASCFQEIIWITDTEPPKIDCKEIRLGCNFDGAIPQPDPSTVKAKDNCCLEGVSYLFDSDIVVFGCEYSLLRYWEAVDCCGNRDTCAQSISWLNDPNPPVFTSCPPDIDLGCNPDLNDLADPSLNYVAAKDDCGDVKIELVDNFTENEGCEYKRFQSWKATDECGNMSFCSRIISYIIDKEAPVIINCPPDLDLGCVDENFQIPPATPDLVEWEDDCGAEVTVLPFIDIVVYNCTYSFGYVYIVTDNCGNADTCFQNISWTFDNTPPEFTLCPPDLDLGCNPDLDDLADPSINAVAAEDFCGEVKIERLEDEVIIGEDCSYKRIQTWKATDKCGNMSTCQRVISYTLDNEAPIITSCPPDIDFGCVGQGFELPDPSPEDVEWEDNCGAEVEVLPFIDIVVFNCTYSFGYVYIVKDNCGNADTCIQHISWTIDQTPPVFTQCPPDLDLGCNPDLDDLADPSLNAVAAEDFCGEVEIERLDDEVFILEDCTYKRIQTWKATDRCGNMSTCQRVIKYTLDEEAPVITNCPPDLYFGCVGEDFVIPEPRPEDVEWEDNCGAEVEVLPFLDIVVVNCTFSFGYVYVVTDYCGNADTCIQHISWTRDDIGPAFTYCPQNIDLGCNPDQETIDEALNDKPIVEDFCGDVVVDLNEVRVQDGCMILINQRWAAFDDCENVTVCSRTIKYTLDTLQPEVISCPEDAHLGCLNIAPFFAPFNEDDYNVTDNCGNVNFTHYDQIVESANEECLFTFRRFVTIFDDCGNLNSCVTEYTWYQVEDTNLDIPFPEDLTIVCGEIPPAPDFGGRNCGIGVPELLQEIIVGDCAQGNCTVFRAWLKKDCNGNIEIHIQTITLICQDITTLRNSVQTRNKEDKKNLHFKIYPNPGNNVINIENNLNADSPYQILIMDQVGKLVLNDNRYNGGEKVETIDVSNYAPGVYYVEFRTEGFRAIQKWIKAK